MIANGAYVNINGACISINAHNSNINGAYMTANGDRVKPNGAYITANAGNLAVLQLPFGYLQPPF